MLLPIIPVLEVVWRDRGKQVCPVGIGTFIAMWACFDSQQAKRYASGCGICCTDAGSKRFWDDLRDASAPVPEARQLSPYFMQPVREAQSTLYSGHMHARRG